MRCFFILKGLSTGGRILEGALPPVPNVVLLPLDDSIEVLRVLHEDEGHDDPKKERKVAHVQ